MTKSLALLLLATFPLAILSLGALAVPAQAGDERRVVGTRRAPATERMRDPAPLDHAGRGGIQPRGAPAPRALRRLVRPDRGWRYGPDASWDLYENDVPAPEPILEIVYVEVQAATPPRVYEAEDVDLAPDHGTAAYEQRRIDALERLLARGATKTASARRP